LLWASAFSDKPLQRAPEPLDNHDGSAVDLLATNAFDESPQQDIGYFGKLYYARNYRQLT